MGWVRWVGIVMYLRVGVPCVLWCVHEMKILLRTFGECQTCTLVAACTSQVSFGVPPPPLLWAPDSVRWRTCLACLLAEKKNCSA